MIPNENSFQFLKSLPSVVYTISTSENREILQVHSLFLDCRFVFLFWSSLFPYSRSQAILLKTALSFVQLHKFWELVIHLVTWEHKGGYQYKKKKYISDKVVQLVSPSIMWISLLRNSTSARFGKNPQIFCSTIIECCVMLGEFYFSWINYH